ncbi:MAG TPA: transglutaminase-like domain-containing protein [archaeon]|nr:transglutaminase-like domain-containing protein [archaeon]
MPGYRLGIKDAVHVSFIVFALVMVGLLVEKYYVLGEAGDLEISPESLGEVQSQTDWYGIYMKDEKIGYSRTTVVHQDSIYICTDRTYLAFTMIGRKQSVNTYARAVTDSSLSLISFIFSLSGEDTDFGLRGHVDGKALSIDITVGGESRVEKIPFDELPQLPETIMLRFNTRELKGGERFRTTVFDPASLSNQPLEIEVAGRESIMYNGRSTETWHLRQNMGGMQVDSYLDDEGNLLEERSQMGYRVVLEDELTARNGNWPEKGSDIQRLVSVKPDIPLPEARSLTELRVELTGIGQDTFGLRGGCQSYEDRILDVVSRMPGPETMADTVPIAIRDVNTTPTPFVQSEHPRLLALVAGVVNLDDSPVEKVRTIIRWMNGNIQKKPTFSIPNTLEVLERKSGDCNEFAVLFCALARACHIPTRIAMGLVYVEDAFYYHAWCECYLGEWVAVDPIFDQFPADATHLRFMAGDMDRQVEIMPIVGLVGIKVLDYKTGPGEQ